MSAVTAFKVKSQLTDSEFDQLFREHYQLVYRTAFRVTRSEEDAEDVLQTVFLRLVRREFPPELKKIRRPTCIARHSIGRWISCERGGPATCFPPTSSALRTPFRTTENLRKKRNAAFMKPSLRFTQRPYRSSCFVMSTITVLGISQACSGPLAAQSRSACSVRGHACAS